MDERDSMDPRTRRTRARALDAAFKLLGEEGIEATTVERIAECAGVHKTTIYRNWPEREQLLADALQANMVPPEFPDTGSVRGDLLAGMNGLARTLSRPPWSVLLPSLIVAAAKNPLLADLHREFTARRRSATIEIVERGKQRGELPPDLDSAHLVDLLAGAIVYRRLMSHEPVDERWVEHHVDTVLGMCTPGR